MPTTNLLRPGHRSKLCFVLSVLALSLASPSTQAQNMTTDAVVNSQSRAALAAAQRDFADFVLYQTQKRSGGAANGFPLDISDMQDLKNARVSYGFPVYTVDPKDLLAGRSDLQALAKANGQWRFVISLNDKPIGLATVEQINGRWETLSYGGAVLAQDVDAAFGFHANANRSNTRFIRVYQAKSDFLEVVAASDGRARFMPLYSARQSLLLQQRSLKQGDALASKDGLLDSSDVLDPLRAAIKSNLDAFR